CRPVTFRTCQLCSSRAPPDRCPGGPAPRGPHRAPPSLRKRVWHSPRTCRRSRRHRARCARSPTAAWPRKSLSAAPAPSRGLPLLHLLDDLLEFRGHLGDGRLFQLHPAVGALVHDQIHFAETGCFIGKIVAEVAPAALLAVEG